MKLIYAKKIFELETESKEIELFFQDVKITEPDLRLVFKLLNQIFKSMKPSGGSRSIIFGNSSGTLDLSNFSSFINSRTQNIALIEYFAEKLLAENPKVVDNLLTYLERVEDVVETDLQAIMYELECEIKSMGKIEPDLKKVSESSSMSNEDKVIVGEVIKFRPEMKKLKEGLDARMKIFGAGVTVLLDLFKISSAKANENIVGVVDAINEFYALFRDYIDGPVEEDEEEDGSEEGDEEEN